METTTKELTMKNEQATRLDPAATTPHLRRALKAAFPGTKFSVRLSRGTGYGNCHVSWTDGPTGDEVRTVTEQFRGQGFDGMTDSTTFRDAFFTSKDGERFESGLGLVLLHRNGYCA